MFKYFKEMRELKKTERQYKVMLLSRLYGMTELLDNIPLLLEVANKVKDMNPTDAQKEIVESLVKFMKEAKEESGE